MAVNHEVKGNLARLLATEDLVVEHKKVDTAQFNVHTRVLTLPMWEKASNTVYDLLVGHEVGHALYTPDEDWLKEHKIPPQFVNVVEDARIEKLMKRRYAGLNKTFYRGYQELSDEDFFGIGDDDIATYNLADKVNLYYKIGNYIDIPFSEFDEMPIVRMIGACETFSDVLIAAEFLYKFCKKKQEEETKTPMDSLQSQQTGSSQPASDFSNQPEGENENDQNQPSDSNSYGGTDEQEINQGTEHGGDIGGEPEVKTAESLEDSLKDLIAEGAFENVYLEIQDIDLSAVIVPNNQIHDLFKLYWPAYEEDGFFEFIDQKYVEFKKSAQKEVSYLVKEFECKKSASAYARASTSRTGVLDTSKLHTYKYNEDLFKKVTVIPDGKNHGLIFVLDWSGSMGDVMLDTIKQLFNLIWFCKKVSIPFEVYAFTCEWTKVRYDDNGKAIMPKPIYNTKDGVFLITEYFSLLNLFTSNTRSKDLEKQMKNIFRLAASFGRTYYTTYPVPNGLSLSGTPLNESLICLHKIIPQFKKQHDLEKVQCVILTDGEAPPMKYHRELHRHWESEPFIGTGSIHTNCILRDRKLGTTYSFDGCWQEQTQVLLNNLKDKFVNTNFIGIRVLESRDAGQFIRRHVGFYGDEYDKVMNAWKKTRAFSLKDTGYHSYFGLSANALSQETEFEVAESATKTQIKSAFVKSLRTKKMNKRVLSEFIELVA